MTSAEWDRETEKRLKEVWKWLLDPNRKPAALTWTAGGERQIGYLIEFALSNNRGGVAREYVQAWNRSIQNGWNDLEKIGKRANKLRKMIEKSLAKKKRRRVK